MEGPDGSAAVTAGSAGGRVTRFGFLLAASALLAAAVTGAAAKFHAIAIGAYRPGSRILITETEFDRYLQQEIPVLIGPGIRNARVTAEPGNIVRGTADMDFLKLRQAAGAEKPNWLMQQLLSGEREVSITVRVTSGHGICRVDPVRVTVSGITAEGRTLDILISTFVMPTFPDAKIGRDFEMGYNIDRLEFAPGGVTVVLRR